MRKADAAGAIALIGLGLMKNATKQGIAAVSGGLSKVRKQYATKHEADVIAELRKKGVSPREILFQALQRLDFLSRAGYTHEVILVSKQTAKRLIDGERSAVPLDMVLVLGGSMSDEAMRYGDFQNNSILKELKEYINLTRMCKDHYDRDLMVHDFYYAALLCVEEQGADWQLFEALCKEAVGRIVSLGGTGERNHELQHNSAKTIFTFASAVRIAAQEEEQKRNKILRDAEALIQREQERRARSLGLQPSHRQGPVGSGSSI
ncbi:uncharacterized protein [Physcomitrium patens]|uniref:Uncharacterized protein n=1 Tax=Physcomitrium patens TaxID=3218 RepID=A0A2K1KJR5_PHYPA|nr:uncharacterized protein LOC112282030 [Physcomitrium patens]XP_024374916.1 uncharacterized protein LOC112282030 [Physcomitrium patens]XP_024374917.1 uncharacterized protein LOC112282030 [Physcomitrium patens]XP_024374918.1 uncharacterized protein LOC112282030 [Physcomitrium patens]PNR54024.1 hypothetical protein PHYPA_007700 [Physcomitrium patens]|eukprot:XP_024374915.1 uncharacterized protein LOC112282030 [Physcomitrella patens]